MKTALRVVLFASAVLVGMLAVCVRNPSPLEDTSNARIRLILPAPPDTGYLVNDSLVLGLDLFLSQLADSVYVSAGGGWDTTLLVTTRSERDTIFVGLPLLIPGADTIDAIMYLEDGAMRLTDTVVTVRGLAVVITRDLPGMAGGKTGESCTLSVAASGSPPLSYAWYKNGAAITGASKDTLVLANLQPADSGSYFCIVRDNHTKSDTSRTATVIVRPLETPDPPSALIIAEETDLTLKLVWPKVDSADAYRVYRDTVKHAITTYTTQVVDTSATLEHQSRPQYFWVTTVKGDLESLPSHAVRWEPDTSKLYPPTNLVAVRINADTVRVRWDGADNATSYIIRRNQNRNTTGYLPIATVTNTWYSDPTKYDYYYYLVSVNATDTSVSSDTVGVTDSTEATLVPAITDCQDIVPGSSINAKILEVYQSSLHKGTICPSPGLYDSGTIEVQGEVQVWIR